MTLGEHLEELRRRLIYALLAVAASTVAALCFCPALINLLRLPYHHAMERLQMPGELVVLGVADSLSIYLMVSLYAGLIVSAPVVLHQLWLFVGAGLYRRERRMVMLSVPFSAVLFLGGAAFFLAAVSEPILYYFMSVSRWLGTVPMITFDRYIGFMAKMMVLFGLAFQTPLVVLVLAAVGIVSIRGLNKYRRHVIIAVLVVAGVLTPPDPFSQIALAVPLWGLYELGVLLAYLLVGRKPATGP